MMRNRLVFLIFILIFIMIVIGCDSEESGINETYANTFRMGESHPKSHPTAQANLEFVKRVEEETNGRVKIIIFFDNELGEEKELIEQVRFGAIDFARVSIAPMSEIVPKLYVLQLPYLYKDRDHMWRVLDSEIGDELLDEVENYGFLGLTWFDGGARSFYTRDKPIESLTDLNGLTIRLMQSTLMADMSEAMGFVGEAKPYGEVYSLLQQGTVDGAENNFSSYLTSSHYEVAKYYIEDEHLRIPEIIIGSKIALDNISDEDWEIIIKVAKETTIYQKQLWSEMEEAAKKILIEKGVQLIEIEDRQEFIKSVQPVYDKYKENYGSLIERIMNIQ